MPLLTRVKRLTSTTTPLKRDCCWRHHGACWRPQMILCQVRVGRRAVNNFNTLGAPTCGACEQAVNSQVISLSGTHGAGVVSRAKDGCTVTATLAQATPFLLQRRSDVHLPHWVDRYWVQRGCDCFELMNDWYRLGNASRPPTVNWRPKASVNHGVKWIRWI